MPSQGGITTIAIKPVRRQSDDGFPDYTTGAQLPSYDPCPDDWRSTKTGPTSTSVVGTSVDVETRRTGARGHVATAAGSSSCAGGCLDVLASGCTAVLVFSVLLWQVFVFLFVVCCCS